MLFITLTLDSLYAVCSLAKKLSCNSFHCAFTYDNAACLKSFYFPSYRHPAATSKFIIYDERIYTQNFYGFGISLSSEFYNWVIMLHVHRNDKEIRCKWAIKFRVCMRTLNESLAYLTFDSEQCRKLFTNSYMRDELCIWN